MRAFLVVALLCVGACTALPEDVEQTCEVIDAPSVDEVTAVCDGETVIVNSAMDKCKCGGQGCRDAWVRKTFGCGVCVSWICEDGLAYGGCTSCGGPQ